MDLGLFCLCKPQVITIILKFIHWHLPAMTQWAHCTGKTSTWPPVSGEWTVNTWHKLSNYYVLADNVLFCWMEVLSVRSDHCRAMMRYRIRGWRWSWDKWTWPGRSPNPGYEVSHQCEASWTHPSSRRRPPTVPSPLSRWTTSTRPWVRRALGEGEDVGEDKRRDRWLADNMRFSLAIQVWNTKFLRFEMRTDYRI